MTLICLYLVHLLTMSMQLFGLVRSVKRRRIYAAFLAGLLLYHALALPGLGYFLEEFGVDILAAGEFVALFGTFAILVTINFLESVVNVDRYNRSAEYLDDVVSNPTRYFIIVGFSFFIIVLVTLSRGSILIESNWEASRSSLGILDSGATLLQFMAFPVVWILFRMGRRGLSALALLLTIMIFAAYGSRAALLTIPAMIGLDYYNRGLLFDKRYALGVTAFIMLLVVLFHVGGRVVRGLGVGGLLSIVQGDYTPIAMLIDDPAQIDWSGGESSITFYYLFVIREVPIEGVETLATVFRWLTMYVPRSVVPDLKSVDPTYLLWLHAANAGIFDDRDVFGRILEIVQQGDMGSLHALFWGEAWMNGGIFALITMCVAMGCILVMVETCYDRLPATVVTLLAPATAIGYLMVARGNSVVGLGFIAYLVLPVLLGYFCLWLFDLLITSASRR